MTPEKSFAEWLTSRSSPIKPLNAKNAQEHINTLIEGASDNGFADLEQVLKTQNGFSQFLGAAMDLSPFLRDCLRRMPQLVNRLNTMTIDAHLSAVMDEIAMLDHNASIDEAQIMRQLRLLKGRAHVLIALDDLANCGQSVITIERLSQLAKACIGAAVRFLLRSAHHQGKLALPDVNHPEASSGWIILAMGKLGANELNFSSDIDLVVFFDPTALAIKDPYDAIDVFVRLTKRLVRILNDRTEHGYVFRTDLRLRPDPGSTPLAIPVEAALNYYEGRGQNWERAAMIKARAIAGDICAGNEFLRELQPFIWRKYMDYAAIADVHSIKRQIHAHKGHGEIAVAGHNVKLGRGGIREIEFFVQTQQLIAGGRFAQLRGRSTISMLDELALCNWIAPEVRNLLTMQYWFLRNCEHAIQMVNDEQTHKLPDDSEGLRRIAFMLGFDDSDAFSDALRISLKAVESQYAALFETAPELSSQTGNLVFTGDVDDPDTIETMRQMGFERPSDMIRVMRSWHFGRYRATRSPEARQRLTEMTPALLKAFGQTRRADEALLRFDEFLSGLPAGIQLFSLLQSNPSLLNLLATIMGAAPRLAQVITRRPHVFDGLLDPALLSEMPRRAYLAERLDNFLIGATIYEDVLDRLRIFAAEQRFLIGIRLLTGGIDANRAGKAFSDLADLTISVALDAVITEFSKRHGSVEGGKVAILGMGKLGSRELTAGSDVDLILLYDHHKDCDYSDGEKPLATAHYFARLTQRLIAAVSAPTAEGTLYELDLRLRPSGNKGPVATQRDAFCKYQQNDAWTWEHMALTRARFIAGDGSLIGEINEEIEAIINKQRDEAKILKEADEMREIIAHEKPPRDIWDIKLIEGGIIDLEFIAQTVVLLNGIDRNSDGTRPLATHSVLSQISPKFAKAHEIDILVHAHKFYSELAQVTRICLTGPMDADNLPPGMVDIMCDATATPDFSVLKAHIEDTSKQVRALYNQIIRDAVKA